MSEKPNLSSEKHFEQSEQKTALESAKQIITNVRQAIFEKFNKPPSNEDVGDALTHIAKEEISAAEQDGLRTPEESQKINESIIAAEIIAIEGSLDSGENNPIENLILSGHEKDLVAGVAELSSRAPDTAEAVAKNIDKIELQQIELEKTKKEWGLASEIIKRELLESSDVRDALVRQLHEPLSEGLSHATLQELSVTNPRIKKFLDSHFSKNLSEITNTETIITDTTRDSKRLGLSKTERAIALEKWRMGRDVKMLGLMSDLIDSPIEMIESEDYLIGTTSHGVELISNHHSSELLNPGKWESRRQIKDRVYEVFIDGKRYIQKEQKTKQHRDTMQGGKIWPMSSRDEFIIGKKLSEAGSIDKDEFSVRFEKPLGAATFPDGYSFAMFEFDESIADDDLAETGLAAKIISDIFKGTDKDYAELHGAPSDKDYDYIQHFATEKDFALFDAANYEKKVLESKFGVYNRDAGKNWKLTKNKAGKRFDLLVYDYEFYQANSQNAPVLYNEYDVDGNKTIRTQLLEKWGYKLEDPSAPEPDGKINLSKNR